MTVIYGKNGHNTLQFLHQDVDSISPPLKFGLALWLIMTDRTKEVTTREFCTWASTGLTAFRLLDGERYVAWSSPFSLTIVKQPPDMQRRPSSLTYSLQSSLQLTTNMSEPSYSPVCLSSAEALN